MWRRDVAERAPPERRGIIRPVRCSDNHRPCESSHRFLCSRPSTPVHHRLGWPRRWLGVCICFVGVPPCAPFLASVAAPLRSPAELAERTVAVNARLARSAARPRLGRRRGARAAGPGASATRLVSRTSGEPLEPALAKDSSWPPIVVVPTDQHVGWPRAGRCLPPARRAPVQVAGHDAEGGDVASNARGGGLRSLPQPVHLNDVAVVRRTSQTRPHARAADCSTRWRAAPPRGAPGWIRVPLEDRSCGRVRRSCPGSCPGAAHSRRGSPRR